jgi:hypothetical protein
VELEFVTTSRAAHPSLFGFETRGGGAGGGGASSSGAAAATAGDAAGPRPDPSPSIPIPTTRPGATGGSEGAAAGPSSMGRHGSLGLLSVGSSEEEGFLAADEAPPHYSSGRPGSPSGSPSGSLVRGMSHIGRVAAAAAAAAGAVREGPGLGDWRDGAGAGASGEAQPHHHPHHYPHHQPRLATSMFSPALSAALSQQHGGGDGGGGGGSVGAGAGAQGHHHGRWRSYLHRAATSVHLTSSSGGGQQRFVRDEWGELRAVVVETFSLTFRWVQCV